MASLRDLSNVACIVGVSRRTLSCFVAPSRDRMHQHKTVALPARIRARGIEPRLPALSANARVALDNAMLL